MGVATPAVPALLWWNYARNERHKRAEEVRTRVRLPNVQTVDDIMVEKCRPGDVILFDRRPQLCAAGPWAALSCLVGRALLCNDGEDQARSVDHGKFDHAGTYGHFLNHEWQFVLFFKGVLAFVSFRFN